METDQEHPPPVPASKKKYYIDSTVVYKAREGMEMTTPLRDGQGKATEDTRITDLYSINQFWCVFLVRSPE